MWDGRVVLELLHVVLSTILRGDLIASTREDIEMSMCNDGGFSTNEDSPFDTDTCSKNYFATNFE